MRYNKLPHLSGDRPPSKQMVARSMGASGGSDLWARAASRVESMPPLNRISRGAGASLESSPKPCWWRVVLVAAGSMSMHPHRVSTAAWRAASTCTVHGKDAIRHVISHV